MSSPFPVAPTAEAALHAPAGFAARETEAMRLADGPVTLATEPVGPAFETRESAAEAYAARLGEPWCALRPVAVGGAALPSPARPVLSGGSRWPERPVAPVLWRLQVSWWRCGPAEPPALDDPAEPPPPAARQARRSAAGAGLGALALGRLTSQPLRAVRPQQPLDVGLFEVRPPEAPDRLIADE